MGCLHGGAVCVGGGANRTDVSRVRRRRYAENGGAVCVGGANRTEVVFVFDGGGVQTVGLDR